MKSLSEFMDVPLLVPVNIPVLQLKYNSTSCSMEDSSSAIGECNAEELQNKITVLKDESKQQCSELIKISQNIEELNCIKQVLTTIVAEQSKRITEAIKKVKENKE